MRQSEWEKRKGNSYLRISSIRTLYGYATFFNCFKYAGVEERRACSCMCDKWCVFYYNPLKIINLFQKNAVFLNRSFLHSVLHCLFSHIWLKKNRVEFIWNVACDIIVEYTLDSMHKKSVSRILSYVRKDVYREIESLTGISCITVYEWLCTRWRYSRFIL